MNVSMVKRLILKDWYLLQNAIVGYILAGALGLFMLTLNSEPLFGAGCILLITILIAVGLHLAMATVVVERTEHTLPFIMTLPVTPAEYTTAKILANLLIFLVPWLIILGGAVTLILLLPAVPDGFIPFVVVVVVEILASYLLVLAVALLSESQNWTIAATLVGNLGFQAFLYYVSHLPGVAAANASMTLVWLPPMVKVLVVEVAMIGAIIGATFWLQGRKKDFL